MNAFKLLIKRSWCLETEDQYLPYSGQDKYEYRIIIPKYLLHLTPNNDLDRFTELLSQSSWKNYWYILKFVLTALALYYFEQHRGNSNVLDK